MQESFPRAQPTDTRVPFIILIQTHPKQAWNNCVAHTSGSACNGVQDLPGRRGNKVPQTVYVHELSTESSNCLCVQIHNTEWQKYQWISKTLHWKYRHYKGLERGIQAPSPSSTCQPSHSWQNTVHATRGVLTWHLYQNTLKWIKKQISFK
jgi:hypothetical protein